MSNKDNIIRGLQNKIADQDKQIDNLESMLYKTRLAGVGVTTGTQAIIEQADRDRAAALERIKALEQAREDFMRAVSQIFPVGLLPPPERATSIEDVLSPEDRWKIFSVDSDLERDLLSRGHPVYKFENMCWVGVSIVIRQNAGDTVDFRQWKQPYPGTLEEIQTDIVPRIMALLARAPMREDFASAGLVVSEEIQGRATLELAHYLNTFLVPDLASLKWSQKVREVFDRLIWPELKRDPAVCEADRGDYSRKFREMVNRSFDHMEKAGRGKDTSAIRKNQKQAQAARRVIGSL